MITENELEVGKFVIYKAGTNLEEKVIISSWNNNYIFVKNNHCTANSQAVKREDLSIV